MYIVIRNTVLLKQEINNLQAINYRQVQKQETTKKVLQKDGILTRKDFEKQLKEAIKDNQALVVASD